MIMMDDVDAVNDDDDLDDVDSIIVRVLLATATTPVGSTEIAARVSR